jgi:DNA uptake protein ComE-like DNA-binding protein/endonuclease YncB( thermonuclease family)
METRLLQIALGFVLLLSIAAASEWEVLEHCRLIPNESNDGDSFHVDHGGREYIFRLYYVDAPESKSDSQIEERIAQQANYFGVDEASVLEWGQAIGRKVERVLSKPFTVVTRYQDALGRSRLPRFYAFVAPHGFKTDLASALVANGFARSHGERAKNEFGLNKKYFDEIEQNASSSRKGIWSGTDAYSPSTQTAKPTRSAPSEQSTPVPASRPAQSVLTPPVDQGAIASRLADKMSQIMERRLRAESGVIQESAKFSNEPVEIVASEERVNLNTASQKELEMLPGIGPSLAARIVAGRPYSSLEELCRVPRLGIKKINQMAPLVKF